MFQIKAKVIYNNRIRAGYWRCAFEAPEIARTAAPGTFVTIRPSDGVEPLLRRPFSIHCVEKMSVEIVYQVIGPATKILTQKKSGQLLDVIGPLGNGFNFSDVRNPVLVAGGIGVAPLTFLAEKLAKGKSKRAKGKSLILIGAKSKEQILCEKEFKQLGCEVRVATEDGSRGFKGRVTDLLEHTLTTNAQRPTTIYSCGPKLMLKEASRISHKYNLPGQISLEAHMACGIGACLGCVVRTKSGNKRVCQEGPVFAADEIVW